MAIIIKTIFLIALGIVCLPIYAVCVVILLIICEVSSLSYVDASVYVCEYGQPIITVLLGLLFLCLAIRKAIKTSGAKRLTLIGICTCYITISIYCVLNLIERMHQYAGMSTSEIFSFVVQKLMVMGSVFPSYSIKIHNEPIAIGYIIANIEVYILPIAIILSLYLIQRRIKP